MAVAGGEESARTIPGIDVEADEIEE